MVQEAKQLFRERLATRLQHVDKHLADKEDLLGSAFFVADADLFMVSNWAAHTGIDRSSFANLLADRKRMVARAALRAAMQAEGLPAGNARPLPKWGSPPGPPRRCGRARPDQLRRLPCRRR